MIKLAEILSQSIIDEHLRDVVLSGDLVQTGEHLHEHIDNLSGQTFASFLSLSEDLRDTGVYLLDYIDSKDELLHGRVNTVSGDLLSLSGELDVFKGKSLSTFSKLYLEISGLDQDQSGKLDATGQHLHEHIDEVSGIVDNLSGQTLASFLSLSNDLKESITTERLRDVILSGDLLNTGTLLEGLIDQVSGDLSQSIIDEHLRDVVLSGDLVQTGEHLHEHIDNLSGQTFASFLSLSEDLHDTGDFLHNFIDTKIDSLSGQTLASFLSLSNDLKESITTERLRDVILSEDLLNTGTVLEGLIDQVSGDLSQSIIDEYLRDVVLSGDLVQTGEHLHEHIDNLSGQTFASFLSLSEDLRDTGDFLHNFIHDVSGDLAILIGEGQTGDCKRNWSVLT